jgi:hypothetical protein
MVQFDYTPRVAGETAGLGFTLPLPQRQQGIDVRSASPQSRRAAADASFYEPATDIDTTLTTMRDGYMQGVQELNDLIRDAYSKGYDPRTVDYGDENSMEVNKRFTEKINDIKMREAQLRQAKAITSRFMQQGQVFDQNIEDISNLQGFGGAEDIAKAFNAANTASGYGDDGFQAMQQAREDAIANIDAVYAPYFEKYKDNPIVLQQLQTKYQTNIGALETPFMKPPPAPKPSRVDESLEIERRKKDESFRRNVQSYLSRTEPTYGEEVSVSGLKIGKNITASIGGVSQVATTSSVVDNRTDLSLLSEQDISGGRVTVSDPKYDRISLVAIGKDGRVISDFSGVEEVQGQGRRAQTVKRPLSKDDIVEFRVMATGSAKMRGGAVTNAYDDPSVLTYKDEAQAEAVRRRISELQIEANKRNEKLKSRFD